MKILLTYLLFAFFIITAYAQSTNNFDVVVEIGVCTNFTNSELLKESGYSYVEEGVGRLLMPNNDDEEFNKILIDLKDNPLPIYACNGFIPKELKSVGPDAVHDEILAFAETAFRRADMVGVKIIVFGSGGSRSIPDDFDRDVARLQFIDLCKRMGPIAERYGVTVVIEPLNTKECNFINSVAEGGELLKVVNHPNIQLLADIYHMKMEDEGHESIVNYGKFIKHVHIAEKQDRAVPGTNNEDFRAYFNALEEIGYEGKLSVEARWANLQLQAPEVIKTILYQYKN